VIFSMSANRNTWSAPNKSAMTMRQKAQTGAASPAASNLPSQKARDRQAFVFAHA